MAESAAMPFRRLVVADDGAPRPGDMGWPSLLSDRADTLPPIRQLTPGELGALTNLAVSIARALLDEFWPRWNQRHGTSYDRAFWRYLAYPWLIDIAQATVKRHYEAGLVLDSLGPQPLEAVVYDDPPSGWGLADLGDLFARKFLTTEFDRWLTSRVLRAILPGRGDRVTLVPMASQPPALTAVPVRRVGRVDGARGHLGWLSGTVISVWARLCALAARPAPRQEAVNPCPLPAPPPSSPLLALCRAVALATEPSTVGEAFVGLDRWARGHSYRAGAVRVVFNELYYGESSKFLAAHAHLAGEKIVTVQHGAQYGLEELLTNCREIEYPQFCFLTWGWTHHGGHPGHFLPVAHGRGYRLSPVRPSSGALVLVGVQLRQYHPRLTSAPSGTGLLHYREAKLAFLGALAKAPLAAVRYRPGGHEAEQLPDADYLHQQGHAVPVLEGPLSPAMRRARLVVCDYPGTVFLDALAANLPVIGTWSQDYFRWADSALPMLAELEAAGLYVQDPAAAAAQVNRVWEDVEGWWRSAPVQAARRRFIRAYCRNTRWWPLYWLTALWRLSRAAQPLPWR